jgi:hypothetical protein
MLLTRRAAIAAGTAATGASLMDTAQAQRPAMPPVTHILANYITQARFEDLPANVRQE